MFNFLTKRLLKSFGKTTKTPIVLAQFPKDLLGIILDYLLESETSLWEKVEDASYLSNNRKQQQPILLPGHFRVEYEDESLTSHIDKASWLQIFHFTKENGLGWILVEGTRVLDASSFHLLNMSKNYILFVQK